MLRVTIEMLPGGSEEDAITLGVGYIANDVRQTARTGGELGDYTVRLMKSSAYAKRSGVWRRGAVKRFPRRRLGPWDLLYRALAATVGDRNRGV